MVDAIRGCEYREASRERAAVRIDEKPLTIEAPRAGDRVDPLLGRAVGRLPPREAAVIEMLYWRDLNQRETACALGISRHAVRRAEASALWRLGVWLGRRSGHLSTSRRA
jgi:DNA-directed RNA polymerase specialized sigma24 family protein